MRRPSIVDNKVGPEEKIVQDLLNYLKVRDWFVKRTHGNMFQSGFPDLYAAKRNYGSRWIEVKCPHKYCFTNAQLEDFPKLSGCGVGIWILTAANEHEYNKLFQPPNWYQYLSIMK
jgi:hypothetical protein